MRRASPALVGSGCLSLAIMLPLLWGPWSISLNDDWTQIFAFQAFLRDSILTWGELPERSHMLGGGFPLPGHPEYPVLSPLTVTILAFGPVLGTKLNVLFVFALGLWGMWRLCRGPLALGWWVSAWATSTFAAAGWLPAVLESGNYPQIYVLWTPLLASLLLPLRPDAPMRWGRVVAAALVAATMLLEGHLNTLSCLLVIGMWSLLCGRLATSRTLAMGALAVLLALYKILPTLSLLSVERRAIAGYEGGRLETASGGLPTFLGWTGPVDGFALGWLPWLLALGSVVVIRKAWRPAVMLAASTLLFLGPEAPLDLFRLIHALPGFESMDAPGKYFVFFVGFFAILLGAYTLQAVPERWRPAVCAVAIAATAAPLWWANRPVLARVFPEAPSPRVQRAYTQLDTPYFVGGGWRGPADHRPDLFLYYRRGLAVISWEDDFQLPPVTVPRWVVHLNGTLSENPAWRGEAWSPAGEAQLQSLTPNSLRVGARLWRPGRVIVNQRYQPGWTCGDVPTMSVSGRLALRLPAGEHSAIDCEYRSEPLRVGASVSAVVLFGLALLAWARRRTATVC